MPHSKQASQSPEEQHGMISAIVRLFLRSNLSLILILLSVLIGLGALMLTPREEDPQIVVPLADVYVNFPGHSAKQVEQLVTTPLEKLLYQIDGVEYVYSQSHTDQAIVTVRYYVGQDRERSLVKLYKKIDENLDLVPPGVTNWVIKPVEINDVPIVDLTLTSKTAGSYMLRRVAEELVQRLSQVGEISRAYVIGGEPRLVTVHLNAARMKAHDVSPLMIERAIEAANTNVTAGTFKRDDQVFQVETGGAYHNARELENLVVTVTDDRPVFLKDVAKVTDGPGEVNSYEWHGWGPARGFAPHHNAPGTLIAGNAPPPTVAATTKAAISPAGARAPPRPTPAVTIAIAKQKGTNAVWVARDVIAKAHQLDAEVVPANMRMVITRNYGLSANNKVNELVEALFVAILGVVALLTISMGWREAFIVAVAVPVVFGLTLAVNLLLGFTINRVTLFALILALGLLVDDPIVDVENIVRHFTLARRASRQLVLGAVTEVLSPLIAATLAVIVSFLPMFFITGMMGPYMRPMALNVPVAMIMSMVVAFTITPWLAYHLLRRHYNKLSTKPPAAPTTEEREAAEVARRLPPGEAADMAQFDPHGLTAVRKTVLWRIMHRLMGPLLRHRWASWTFLGAIALLALLAGLLAATRRVPLKMLPFDNKNELLLVLNLDRGTTLERTDAAVRDFEHYLQTVPQIVDFTSYVGIAAPMDFNGMVRHYYLRKGDDVAEIRMHFVAKKNRRMKSHALALKMRDPLTKIARRDHVRLKIVETPPGPPVIDTIVAEVYGRVGASYNDLIAAARTVKARLAREPLVVDVDDTIQAPETKWVFVPDKEKAALNGVTVTQIAQTLRIALGGAMVGTVQKPNERNPLQIELRLPRAQRSSRADLARLNVMGRDGQLVPLSELGSWHKEQADQTIYHKNLKPVVYVFADVAGRPPAGAIIDTEVDRYRYSGNPAQPFAGAGVKVRTAGFEHVGSGWVSDAKARPLANRTYFSNGSGIAWAVPNNVRVVWTGEGEWEITLRVFRDLGLAFAAALVGIYILLVWQTESFMIPLVVMMAIPLTVIGVMPGFWILNLLTGQTIGHYPDPVFFTATAMIGMIALAGIVTRNSIILIDFIHLSLARGRNLFDAIVESAAVRLRPILLTAGAAMIGAVPITIDPIFAGLAWSLIFGLFASTLFTLFVIPVTYWLLYANKPGHGVPTINEDD